MGNAYELLRCRGVAAVVILALTAVGLPGTAAPALAVPQVEPAPRTADERFAEDRLYQGHHLARHDPASFGHGGETSVPLLHWAEDLAQVARHWSDRVASEQQMYHNPYYTDQACCWVRIGENVAYWWHSGLSGREAATHNADAIMQGWMDSEGHRPNIMHPDYREVGLGVTIDADGRLWATAVFRAPDSSITLPPPPEPEGPAPPPVEVPGIVDTTTLCGSETTTSWFVDVEQHVVAIECLATTEVTLGVGDHRFDPFGHVTRGQMATFITRAIEATGFELPEVDPARFPDVEPDLAVATPVAQLAELGIVSGRTDGTYGPDDPVTRAQMAHFLVAAYELAAGVELADPSRDWFLDVPATHTFERAIGQAADLGLAAGDGAGNYGPPDPVRRDHMALFLTRWLTVAGG